MNYKSDKFFSQKVSLVNLLKEICNYSRLLKANSCLQKHTEMGLSIKTIALWKTVIEIEKLSQNIFSNAVLLEHDVMQSAGFHYKKTFIVVSK